MMTRSATIEPSWADPPHTLELGPASVHVWRIPLDDWRSSERAALYASLSPDEQLRAARFHFERDRDRFVVAHGVLRELLGRYLDTAPAALSFAYSAYGKPALKQPETTLRFNLSHSHQLALLAVASERELGVDIEYRAAARADEDLARQFCAPDELAALASLPPAQWETGFYNAWTRKEALIKARGEGLSLPLTKIIVALLPAEPARLIRSSDPADLSRWSMHALEPAPGYAAALVAAGQAPRIDCYRYEHGGNVADRL